MQVFEQTLDLQPQEIVRLEDYLIDNLRHPEYAYRFLDDNCTTRVAKAIEHATGREITTSLTASHRRFTDAYMDAHPFVETGANLLMGKHAERPAKVFLPNILHDSLNRPSASGRHWIINPPKEEALTQESLFEVHVFAKAFTFFLFLGSLAIVLFLSIPTLLRHKKKKPLPRRAYLDALLFAKIGLIGCLMSFLGFWSHHPELGAFNWNLIWCWPTHLVFAFFLLFSAHGKSTRLYARTAAIGATCAALAYFFVPQALPLPLFPVVLLLALRAWRIGFHREAVIVPGQG